MAAVFKLVVEEGAVTVALHQLLMAAGLGALVLDGHGVAAPALNLPSQGIRTRS